MARELIIKIKCDFCGDPVDEADVRSGEFVFGGKAFSVDLCGDDFDSLMDKVTPKAKLLAQAVQPMLPTGQKQYPSNKKGKVLPCPACGHLVKNELGLKFHIRKMHPGSDG